MQGAPEDEYFKVNRDFTLALAQKAKSAGVHHFVFLSTAHVFGDSGTIKDHSSKLAPHADCAPHDAYGRSKLEAERELLKIADEGFKVSIIRPPMVYGEDAKGNAPRLAQLIQKMPILPFGYFKNRRSLIYVGNLTSFIDHVLKKPQSQIFLPQDAKALSIGEMVHIFEKVLGKTRILIPVPHVMVKLLTLIAPGFVVRLFGTLHLDSDQSFSTLGFHPPFSTEEGFSRMCRSLGLTPTSSVRGAS